METSIASSHSIGKEEVFDPTYESNLHFDWELEECAIELEIDKEEVVMYVVVSEPKSQQEGDTSMFGSHVGLATNPTPTPQHYACRCFRPMKSWLSGQDVQANDTDGWDTPYSKQIKEFQRIVGNDVATKEIIEIDLVEGLSDSSTRKKQRNSDCKT
ncbi:hypothetical protein RHGRI_005046 [Rhododendron griersonianum]|uniref:Uncharacterized protein n=1 Tax=Rhododendron griersonianum TaxID=479676 RepID=A0AAV6LCN0_9ERIC|nr:hypothetical protein RHGRI_005046 [Rhododendron griersonianum]